MHRLTFDGNRATGIVLSRGGRVEIVDAAREVILAAGAIGSPHLLQLSGVGEPGGSGEGRDPGAPRAARGSASNFQDHYIARMSAEVRGIETLNERGRGLPFARELLRYALTGGRAC